MDLSHEGIPKGGVFLWLRLQTARLWRGRRSRERPLRVGGTHVFPSRQLLSWQAWEKPFVGRFLHSPPPPPSPSKFSRPPGQSQRQCDLENPFLDRELAFEPSNLLLILVCDHCLNLVSFGESHNGGQPFPHVRPKRKLETPPEPACKRLETVEEKRQRSEVNLVLDLGLLVSFWHQPAAGDKTEVKYRSTTPK